MKKSVVALVFVVLMLASSILLLVPQAEAQLDTSQVKIISYSQYVAPADTVNSEQSGDLVVVGEIKNMGSNTIGTVYVSGVAFNSAHDFLSSANNRALETSLDPGQTAPFYLDFTAENSASQDLSWVSSVSNLNLSVAYINAPLSHYSGLAIAPNSLSGGLTNGVYSLVGTVQNNGNQATQDVWAISTFYDISGKVVALSSTKVSTSISPGGSAKFTAIPVDNTAQLSSSISNYSVLIQADKTSSTSPTPTTQPTSSGNQNQPTHNPVGSSTILIIAGTTVAVIVIVVLVVLLLVRKRHKTSKK